MRLNCTAEKTPFKCQCDPTSWLRILSKNVQHCALLSSWIAAFGDGHYRGIFTRSYGWWSASGNLQGSKDIKWYSESLFFHDDVIKWKHFPRYWPFVRGIHRSPVNSPHKGQWRGALMFTLIRVWINGCVNNREAGDLRRYCAHYGVTVMFIVELLWKERKSHSKHKKMPRFACKVFTNKLYCVPRESLVFIMIASSNANIFCVTGHLWGESTGHLWVSPHTGQWRRALVCSVICAWTNGWVNNQNASYLRHICAHYDVTVMCLNESLG